MATHDSNGWQPDPRRGNWAELFEDRGPPGSGPGFARGAAGPTLHVGPDDADLAPDPTVYRPWTLQRGSRPTLMLELRRYEPRSGLWSGIQLAYPTLLSAEYTGDRLLSLDFGTRQYVIEGRGLDELARHLSQGSVVMVQEYAASLWTANPSQPLVQAIRRLPPSGIVEIRD